MCLIPSREERAALINADGTGGWTILHCAAYDGTASIVKWILSSKKGGGRSFGFVGPLVRTDRASGFRATALHLATAAGYLECCKELVKGCINDEEREKLLNAEDDRGFTALHIATYENRVSIIKWLLSSDKGGGRAAGFTNIHAKAEKKATAFHGAMSMGHLECCQAIVEGSIFENGEREKVLNDVDDTGWTALHHAVSKDQPLVIKWFLLDPLVRGLAYIFKRNDDGLSALHLAAGYGHLECCQAFAEATTAENGVRARLLNDADVDKWNILHFAAEEGHTHVVRWLLSEEEGGGRAAGFASNSITKSTNDFSALTLATFSGSIDCLNALLAGCSVYERLLLFLTVDEHGWTSLHIAVRFSLTDMIHELLAHHPETKTIANFRDNRGMTALHRAVIGGLDKKSRKEWQEGLEEKNFGQAEVIEALLTTLPQDEDCKHPVAAEINPNLGIEIE